MSGYRDGLETVNEFHIFACGPDETGFHECWNCTGPTQVERLRGPNDAGKFCSTECVDEYHERAERSASCTACTVCGRQQGHCSTDHPEDPHEFEPVGKTWTG